MALPQSLRWLVSLAMPQSFRWLATFRNPNGVTSGDQLSIVVGDDDFRMLMPPHDQWGVLASARRGEIWRSGILRPQVKNLRRSHVDPPHALCGPHVFNGPPRVLLPLTRDGYCVGHHAPMLPSAAQRRCAALCIAANLAALQLVL